MAICLILANIFNIADVILTLLLLHLGYGVEGNPIMAELVGNPFLFVCVKVFVMLAVSLWVGREKSKYSIVASWLLVIAFGAIALWNFSILVVAFFATTI